MKRLHLRTVTSPDPVDSRHCSSFILEKIILLWWGTFAQTIESPEIAPGNSPSFGDGSWGGTSEIWVPPRRKKTTENIKQTKKILKNYRSNTFQKYSQNIPHFATILKLSQLFKSPRYALHSSALKGKSSTSSCSTERQRCLKGTASNASTPGHLATTRTSTEGITLRLKELFIQLSSSRP